MTSNPRHEPLFDVHPQTGAAIEVFYADRTLETFGRTGAGWFWWRRRRGFSPVGPAIGPFATSYAAYRHAMQKSLQRRDDKSRHAGGVGDLKTRPRYHCGINTCKRLAILGAFGS